jgi:hypothetical protein
LGLRAQSLPVDTWIERFGEWLGAQRLPCHQDRRTERLTMDDKTVEQDIIALSADKWRWMSDQDMPALTTLFHPRAVFVHMGGAWGTDRELEIIEGGFIHYKRADIHEVSVNVIGATAILLNEVTLLAVVDGNEVTNRFMVTEAYVQDQDAWRLTALAFTKLLTSAEEPPA